MVNILKLERYCVVLESASLIGSLLSTYYNNSITADIEINIYIVFLTFSLSHIVFWYYCAEKNMEPCDVQHQNFIWQNLQGTFLTSFLPFYTTFKVQACDTTIAIYKIIL